MNTNLIFKSELFHFEDELNSEMHLCKKETLPKGTVLVRQQSYVKSLPLVVNGGLRVYKQTEDREILFYYIQAGGTCAMSLASCLEQKQSYSEVATMERSEILLVPSAKVIDWMRKYTSWNNFIVSTLIQRQQQLIDNYGEIAFSKMEKRIKDFLCQMFQSRQSIMLTITHQEIANELGTTRVVISRILKAMEIEGTIKLLRGTIRIKKMVCSSTAPTSAATYWA